MAANVGGHFPTTMDAFVFFDMRGNFFGHGVMVAKNIAKYFLHDVGFTLHFRDLGAVDATNKKFSFRFKVVHVTLPTPERLLPVFYWK